MIKWYVSVRRLMRDIERKSRDALEQYKQGGKIVSKAINEYIKSDYQTLLGLWQQQFPEGDLGSLSRHIHFGMDVDYEDIVNHDLPDLEKQVEEQLLKSAAAEQEIGFENLLHLVILESSYQLFRNGHLREAVLNSITAVFDFIRSRSNSKEDGDRLIGQVFSLKEPLLILSDLKSDSGQNDQKGFMQIFNGAYQGIRNPKAHSLVHDLTELKAAQYLVFASLLARRVEEATQVKPETHNESLREIPQSKSFS